MKKLIILFMCTFVCISPVAGDECSQFDKKVKTGTTTKNGPCKKPKVEYQQCCKHWNTYSTHCHHWHCHKVTHHHKKCWDCKPKTVGCEEYSKVEVPVFSMESTSKSKACRALAKTGISKEAAKDIHTVVEASSNGINTAEPTLSPIVDEASSAVRSANSQLTSEISTAAILHEVEPVVTQIGKIKVAPHTDLADIAADAQKAMRTLLTELEICAAETKGISCTYLKMENKKDFSTLKQVYHKTVKLSGKPTGKDWCVKLCQQNMPAGYTNAYPVSLTKLQSAIESKVGPKLGVSQKTINTSQTTLNDNQMTINSAQTQLNTAQVQLNAAKAKAKPVITRLSTASKKIKAMETGAIVTQIRTLVKKLLTSSDDKMIVEKFGLKALTTDQLATLKSSAKENLTLLADFGEITNNQATAIEKAISVIAQLPEHLNKINSAITTIQTKLATAQKKIVSIQKTVLTSQKKIDAAQILVSTAQSTINKLYNVLLDVLNAKLTRSIIHPFHKRVFPTVTMSRDEKASFYGVPSGSYLDHVADCSVDKSTNTLVCQTPSKKMGGEVNLIDLGNCDPKKDIGVDKGRLVCTYPAGSQHDGSYTSRQSYLTFKADPTLPVGDYANYCTNCYIGNVENAAKNKLRCKNCLLCRDCSFNNAAVNYIDLGECDPKKDIGVDKGRLVCTYPHDGGGHEGGYYRNNPS